MVCSLTCTGSPGSFGFFSVGSAGLSASDFLDLRARVEDTDALDATELERARREGVDRRGVPGIVAEVW
jgi:hypothetical protein